MAEEEDMMDLSNSTSYADLEKLLKENDAIFLTIVGVGLVAHLLIIYTTIKNKRLRSRTNIIIMNWIIFEMLAHNVIYPFLHYVRLHEFSFLLHLLSGDIIFMALLSSLLCLNVLFTDSVMMSNKATFKSFLERFYGVQFTIYAVIFVWKMYTQHDIYMELLLILAYFVSWLVLGVKVLWRQCHRLVKRTTLNTNEELRLHLVTFFLTGKLVVMAFGITSVVYKSAVLMNLSKLWGLSGIYVIVLYVVKDINFKISLFEVLGLNAKNANESDNMIIEDKDTDDNLVETCIES